MSTALAPNPTCPTKQQSNFPRSATFVDELEALNRETAMRAFGFFQQRGHITVGTWMTGSARRRSSYAPFLSK